jgi:medium-chain acyl-[acyl-carrier-protein] hydrolase
VVQNVSVTEKKRYGIIISRLSFIIMIEKIWKENTTVSSFDVGASGHLEPAALMRYFQEVAAHHATHLGVGFDALIEDNIFWALTHLQIEADCWPEMGETISIETWPRGNIKLYTTRDYYLKDIKENILAKATSAWILVDIKRKRPVRSAERLAKIPFSGEKKALGDFPSPIPETPEIIINEKEYPIVYSDLDFNQHVNNARYVEWMMNLIAPEESELLSHINLHFTNEFRRNETANLKLCKCNNSSKDFIISIDHKETGKTGCKGKLKFKQV